eukprot:m.182474 g.182474  ORF g.182474 m.182474 type:complete len:283 (+) comp18064_c0_seq2:224-1072(+)
MAAATKDAASAVEELGEKVSEIRSGLLHPWGIAIAMDGTMFVTEYDKKNIAVFSPDGTLLRSIGDDSMFQKPVGLALHPFNETLAVADKEGAKVVFVSQAGVELGKLAGDVSNVVNVAYDSRGKHLAVAQMLSNVVQVFNCETQSIVLTVADIQMVCAVLFDPVDNLYIANTGNHAIEFLKLDWSGETPTETARKSFKAGMENPVGLAFDAEGQLAVIDHGNSRMLTFDATTGDVTDTLKWAGASRPCDLAINPDGNFVVCDRDANRLVLVTGAGMPPKAAV